MIVIPMAGASRRFTEAGYTQPKYMLHLHGRPLFDHAVLSFRNYFATTPFLFIARDAASSEAFIAERCTALGIVNWRTIMLDRPTRGQAETVAVGIDAVDLGSEVPLTIFNIDTFRPDFTLPSFHNEVAGYLETFVGSGTNWSFVRAADGSSDRAAETAEKRPISDLCCTGIYHFNRAADFRAAFDVESRRPLEQLDAGELYVAPLYNRLIASGLDIRFTVIAREDVVFCGVPAEYHALLNAAADKL